MKAEVAAGRGETEVSTPVAAERGQEDTHASTPVKLAVTEGMSMILDRSAKLQTAGGADQGEVLECSGEKEVKRRADFSQRGSPSECRLYRSAEGHCASV